MGLNSYTFAAIRGIQAGDEYYTCICDLATIPRLFLFNESAVPAELRSQRHVNKSRIPEIANYILENPKNYIFSAITASIDGKVEFKPIKLDKDDLAGTLEQVIKGIEQVAVKQWPYDGKATEDEDKKKKQKELDAFVEIWMKEAKAIDKTKSDQADKFVMFSADIYEKKRYDELFKLKPEQIKNMISGGDVVLKLLEKISKSDEIDSNFKKQLKYLICLCKYWTNIYKEAQKATADEGGGDDGEDEKPKNKKKTKKKPVDEGEGEGEDEEDEKPKRKKKTKKKPADDDDE
jgi:hypothetical protein